MSERNLRIRLGIFVVIALVLLAAMVLMFGSLPTFFKNVNSYTIVFEDAPGVSQGSPVRRSGVHIGEVTDITLDDENNRVLVKIAVEKKYTIRKSEKPTLTATLLGNDAAIDFVPVVVKPPEVVDRSVIPPGSEIEGARQVTINALLKGASDVVPSTQEALNDLRKSLKRIEEMTPLMEETLKEYRDLAKETRKALPEAENTAKEIGALAKRAREAIPNLEKTSDDVGATARSLTTLSERVNLLVAGNEDKIKAILEGVNIFLTRLNGLLSDENMRAVTAILKNVREASDTLPATAKNVRDASDHLPSIAKNTDEGLQDARATMKNFNESLGRADDVIRNLQKATKPLGERGDAIIRNLDMSLEKLNHTLSDVGELMRVVGQSDGTIKRLLTDPALFNKLDEALGSLNKAMPRVDRILQDMETFADKLARHPEALGIGGVVHPGSGLKDPPTTGQTIPPTTPSYSPKH